MSMGAIRRYGEKFKVGVCLWPDGRIHVTSDLAPALVKEDMPDIANIAGEISPDGKMFKLTGFCGIGSRGYGDVSPAAEGPFLRIQGLIGGTHEIPLKTLLPPLPPIRREPEKSVRRASPADIVALARGAFSAALEESIDPRIRGELGMRTILKEEAQLLGPYAGRRIGEVLKDPDTGVDDLLLFRRYGMGIVGAYALQTSKNAQEILRGRAIAALAAAKAIERGLSSELLGAEKADLAKELRFAEAAAPSEWMQTVGNAIIAISK